MRRILYLAAAGGVAYLIYKNIFAPTKESPAEERKTAPKVEQKPAAVMGCLESKPDIPPEVEKLRNELVHSLSRYM
jgi:hypothetical protein